MSVGRGEIWLADLNPTRGHEQAGRRPVAILSEDSFNNGPAGLVVVLPITSTIRPIPSHVVVEPPEGGLRVRSAVICEAIRSISIDRLVERWGRLGGKSLARLEDVLRILLRL
ncbi:MAG: type II toxin-antitoxin system PemK/MazF family toxin [Vicinamibacteria bacterium]